MAYVERDDRDLDFNQESDFYDEDSLYEDLYEEESFGETLNSGRNEDGYVEIDEEEMIVTAANEDAPASKVEHGFGEAINPESNPHLNDQLNDDSLSNEAEADYKEPKNEGILQKAKDKLDEWTDKSERE